MSPQLVRNVLARLDRSVILRPSPRWSAAVALIVVGVAGLLVGTWMASSVPLVDGRNHDRFYVAVIILAALFLAGATLVREVGVQRLGWVVALGMTVKAGYDAISGLHHQYSVGYPDRSHLYAAVGATAVFLGLLLLLRPYPPVSTGRRYVAITTGVTVIALAVPVAAAGLIGVGIQDWTLRATTAAAAQPASVPPSVSRVAYSVRTPATVRDVRPVGTGFVVQLDDGVIAYDGVTGKERWHYRRIGADLVDFWVSPGGGTILTGWRTGGHDSVHEQKMIVLNGVTGVVSRLVLTVPYDFEDLLLTDGAAIYAHNPSSYSVTARSVVSGRQLWRYDAPDECFSNGISVAVTGDRVMVAEACGNEVRLLGFDAVTGVRRWTVRAAMPSLPRVDPTDITARVITTPDASMAVFKTNIVDTPHFGLPCVSIDPASGRVLGKICPELPVAVRAVTTQAPKARQTITQLPQGQHPQYVSDEDCDFTSDATVVLSRQTVCATYTRQTQVEQLEFLEAAGSRRTVMLPEVHPAAKEGLARARLWVVPGAVIAVSGAVSAYEHIVGLR